MSPAPGHLTSRILLIISFINLCQQQVHPDKRLHELISAAEEHITVGHQTESEHDFNAHLTTSKLSADFGVLATVWGLATPVGEKYPRQKFHRRRNLKKVAPNTIGGKPPNMRRCVDGNVIIHACRVVPHQVFYLVPSLRLSGQSRIVALQ